MELYGYLNQIAGEADNSSEITPHPLNPSSPITETSNSRFSQTKVGEDVYFETSPLFSRRRKSSGADYGTPPESYSGPLNDVLGRVSPRQLSTLEQPTPGGGVNLLQAALSTLSLTDKCALSLSLGSTNMQSQSSPRTSRISETMDVDLNGSGFNGIPETSTKLFDDIDSMFESQSVWSENDKESLGAAMSMMGPLELEKVESEVKLIQNNVRAWILRKNYTNLRDAARVLQAAWREKRKDVDATTPRGVMSPLHRKKRRTLHDYGSQSAPGAHNDIATHRSGEDDEKLSSAAATLQALTRGMLARKTFENAKRQGMASLVIQKSLLNWWIHNKDANHKDRPPIFGAVTSQDF